LSQESFKVKAAIEKLFVALLQTFNSLLTSVIPAVWSADRNLSTPQKAAKI
jgi:hypothetical protein